jgi:hypothetical protein
MPLQERVRARRTHFPHLPHPQLSCEAAIPAVRNRSSGAQLQVRIPALIASFQSVQCSGRQREHLLGTSARRGASFGRLPGASSRRTHSADAAICFTLVVARTPQPGTVTFPTIFEACWRLAVSKEDLACPFVRWPADAATVPQINQHSSSPRLKNNNPAGGQATASLPTRARKGNFTPPARKTRPLLASAIVPQPKNLMPASPCPTAARS